MDALAADDLSARYPGQSPAAPALSRVSLRIAPGERVLLLGPNGAGKSTLIRVGAGLMRATGGALAIHGHAPRAARRLVGVVGHATYLYEELTARENLRLYGELYGVANVTARADTLLQQLRLGRLGDERLGRLSRGQQQRVALARALMHNPPVLLLDEPDTGLDQAAFRLLENLARSGGQTVLFATHNLATGLRLCSRVVVLAGGRIVHERDGAGPDDTEALAGLVREIAEADATA